MCFILCFKCSSYNKHFMFFYFKILCFNGYGLAFWGFLADWFMVCVSPSRPSLRLLLLLLLLTRWNGLSSWSDILTDRRHHVPTPPSPPPPSRFESESTVNRDLGGESPTLGVDWWRRVRAWLINGRLHDARAINSTSRRTHRAPATIRLAVTLW